MLRFIKINLKMERQFFQNLLLTLTNIQTSKKEWNKGRIHQQKEAIYLNLFLSFTNTQNGIKEEFINKNEVKHHNQTAKED